MSDSEFRQADTNGDNSLDINEFRNFTAQRNNNGGGNGFTSNSSSFESSSSSGGALGGASYGASYQGESGLAGGAGYGAAGLAGSSGYESSSFSSSTGYGAAGLAGGAGYGAAGLAGGAGYGAGGLSGGSGYEASGFSSSAGYGAAGGAAGYGASSSESVNTTSVQRYATDAQGLFQDSNPQIIRRPAPGGPLTYTQNIRVRFLQPPPIPPPGPLIIKEVRPPQPPVQPPLRIRQQAPPRPQPPPLILLIRKLAALPVPPRSTIIERIAAAPPRPRDIIIERWVPYGAASKRRTVVQRAAAAQAYQQPRNVIIQYESVQARIVRQFQKLGVQPENPQAYVQRYGAQLLDSVTLVQQARAAGVVEDISPPVVPGSFAATEGQFSSTGGASGAGGLTGQGFGGIAGEMNFEATAGGVGSSSNIAHSSFEAHGGGVIGIDSPAAFSSHVGGAGEGATGFGATGVLSQSFSGAGESVQTFGAGSNVGPGSGFAPSTLFNAADTNHDGALSQREFNAAGY
ncbi:unnamed protein product [Adineta steineri]|uniref:EF-hand domain-containing protein n=1 Tax=Adineta steineri TaxID=433720 RepID=A0A813VUA2_9BILA|nr:unnamed protein product [Adineta steineri]CAF0848194.1 unnamed protein product [Adineta steineri]CAF0921138.1 unnamed protein product [Adineta steineri]